MKVNKKVIIIGAGIIGAAISYELSKKGYQVLVLEKNPYPGEETTEGNSGIIHGGFDPTPGKLNARLNFEGRKIYEQKWFKELRFPWKKVNSLVLAFNDIESKTLKDLYERGLKNGLNKNELSIVSNEKAKKIESNINSDVKSALLCTCSYIIDPVLLTYSLLEEACKNGASVQTNSEVTAIKKDNCQFVVNTINNKTYHSDFVINCAGHYADVIANMINSQNFTLKALRGQYCILEKKAISNFNSNILFLVPTIYGKGVLIAPMTNGRILIGPTAEAIINKEDTRIVNFEQIANIKKIAKKIIPSLDDSKISKTISGSRSIANNDDFIIESSASERNFINVAGIKSPGLTSAPAIARLIVEMIDGISKENY